MANNVQIGDGAANNVSFVFAQNDDYKINLTWTNADTSAPVDLANYEFRLYIYDNYITPTDTQTIAGVVENAAAGRFSFSIPRTITAELEQRKSTTPSKDLTFKFGFAEVKAKEISTNRIFSIMRGPVYIVLSFLPEW